MTDFYASRSKSRRIGKTACQVAWYEFLREAAKQKVVHGLVLKPLSTSLVRFFALVQVLQSTHSSGNFCSQCTAVARLNPGVRELH